MSIPHCSRPEVIGHGGAGGHFPGNSRQSIEKALELGVDRVEVDLRLTADGALVLVHNDVLQLPGGSKRAVRTMSTDEIARLLPDLLTFDQMVELIGNTPVVIDVKSSGYEAQVADAIRRHALQASAVACSTHGSVLRALRRELPELRTGISTGHLATGLPIGGARTIVSGVMQVAVPRLLEVIVRSLRATDVMAHYRVCSPRLVRRMHARDVRVNAWTVDRPETIARMIAMGVDSITSNHPERVQQALGIWPATGHVEVVTDR